jgi:hypothetical protein
MGFYYSKLYSNYNNTQDSKNKLIKNDTERQISPYISLGISKYGDTIKMVHMFSKNDEYYLLKKTNIYENTIEFYFENNIVLIIERTNQIIDNRYVLTYKLKLNITTHSTYLDMDNYITNGVINQKYQPIGYNESNFDKIDILQTIMQEHKIDISREILVRK